MSNFGYILGKAGVHDVYLVNQDKSNPDNPKPYRLQEMFMLEGSLGEVPVEVTDTFSIPTFSHETLEEQIEGFSTQLGLNGAKIEQGKPAYVAKCRVLKHLSTPIGQDAVVRKPTFKELEPYVVHVKDSRLNKEEFFTLGVIRGTKELQNELPNNLADLSPLWDKKAVPQKGVPFLFDYKEIRQYPHIGMFGTSGSGKSFGMRTILEELQSKRIPGIVLDPHKEGKFNEPMNGLPKKHVHDFSQTYETFQVGKNMGIPFDELSSSDLLALLRFVSDVSDAQIGAIESIYDKGDTLSYLKQKVDRLTEAFKYYEVPKYMREDEDELAPDDVLLYEQHKKAIVNSNTLLAVRRRLEQLGNTNVFDSKNGCHGIERAILSRKQAVLQGEIKQLKMISFYIIRKLYYKRKKYVESRQMWNSTEKFFPPFFITADEAHNFAPNEGWNPSKAMFKELAQESRKYGVFLVLCTQQTSKLDETIFAQINNKFIYRLQSKDDMELTKAEANLTDEQMSLLANLDNGQAFAVSPILPRTVLIQFRTTFSKSSYTDDIFDEMNDEMSVGNEELRAMLSDLASLGPIRIVDIPNKLDVINQDLEDPVTYDDVTSELDAMAEEGVLKKNKTPIGVEYK